MRSGPAPKTVTAFLALLALVAATAGGTPRPRMPGGAGTDPRPAATLDHAAMTAIPPGGVDSARTPLDPDSGAELIGKPAPPWLFRRWVRGGPLALEALHGHVVLMRFFTEKCRFCEATLPALEQLRRRDGERGLVVLGAFHPPRARQKRSDRQILALADSLGFGGPIACDQDWKTLDRWWLDGHPDRDWVSVSFLIDRDGIVRWVHGGGEYHPSDDPRHHRCDVKFHELEAAIEPLLASRPSGDSPER